MGFKCEPVKPREGMTISEFRYTIMEWDRLRKMLLERATGVALPGFVGEEGCRIDADDCARIAAAIEANPNYEAVGYANCSDDVAVCTTCGPIDMAAAAATAAAAVSAAAARCYSPHCRATPSGVVSPEGFFSSAPTCYAPGCGVRRAAAADVGCKSCARCKLARYCSRKCQQADWKLHKKSCSHITNVLMGMDMRVSQWRNSGGIQVW